jgi:hypothetical protein
MLTLRGILDRIMGGIGNRKGRRDPHNLRIGDTVDFWRVEKYEENKYVKLVSEIMLPGILWLEFIVENRGDKTVLREIFSFIPQGIIGYIYWYIFLPIHIVIFTNMAKEIVKQCEEIY